jgi:hypothetical protein
MRMPKRLQLSPHASTEELEHRYRKAKDPVERSHRQIVWLLSEGRTTEEVCEVTGYSPGWVRRIAHRYNERGVEGLGDRRHANPGARHRGRYSTRLDKGSFERRCAGRRWRAG